MVGRSVALHAEDIAPWLVGIHDADVDPILRYADLRMRFVARRVQAGQEPSFEITVRLFTGPSAGREDSATRIFEKLFQHSHPAAISVGDDARVVEGGEDRARTRMAGGAGAR